MNRHETVVWLSASHAPLGTWQWKIMADHHVVGQLIWQLYLRSPTNNIRTSLRIFSRVDELGDPGFCGTFTLLSGWRWTASWLFPAWLVAALTFWAPVLAGWSRQQVVSSYKPMDIDSTCHLAVTVNYTAQTAAPTCPVRWSSLLPAGLLQATPLSWQSTTKDRLF